VLPVALGPAAPAAAVAAASSSIAWTSCMAGRLLLALLASYAWIPE
jgi:hypothetical protein